MGGAALPIPAPEVEVLVRAARVHLSTADRDSLRALLTRRLNWDLLVALADSHRLVPLLHRHVEAIGCGLVPAGARAALWALATNVASENARRVVELRGLVDALARVGVEAVLMKGPALSRTLFGDISLRPFDDLDMLVPPAQVAAAQCVLRERGYRPTFEKQRLWDEWARRNCEVMAYRNTTEDVICDLHWSLRNEAYSFVTRQEALRQRLEPVEIAGTRYQTLGAEDALCFLLLHGVQLGWPALGLLADVAELVRARPGLDWRIVGAGARGRRRVLQVGLRLAVEVLEAPVPVAVLAEGDADPALPSLMAAARAALLRPTLEALPVSSIFREVFGSIYARSLETRADRLRFAYECVLKPRPADVMAVALPEWAWPAYFVIRPVRLLLKHGPALLPAGLGGRGRQPGDTGRAGPGGER
jgi:hypothetical protein